MEKDLFSTPAESASFPVVLPTTSLMSNQQHNSNIALQASSGIYFVDIATASTTVFVPSIPACVVPPQGTSGETQVVKDIIEFEFKQENICEHHAYVINRLYDDFPRQCRICGLRFKFEEDHNKHMDWHASKIREGKLWKSYNMRSALF